MRQETCASHGRSGFSAAQALPSHNARDARYRRRGPRRVQEEVGRRSRRRGGCAGPGRRWGDRGDRRPRWRSGGQRGRPDAARARAHHPGDERARVGASRPVHGERRAQRRRAARLSAQGRHGRGQTPAAEEVELPGRLVRAAPSPGWRSGPPAASCAGRTPLSIPTTRSSPRRRTRRTWRGRCRTTTA